MKGRFRGKHVAVLLGGLSAEREVSDMSGRKVAAALTGLGYRVSKVRVGRDLGARLRRLHPDVAFNALHGKYGEDGCVQGLLEVMGIPYTGAGVLPSAIAMHKATAKVLWHAAGLPTPRWTVVRAGGDGAPPKLPSRPPLVVKPVSEGSSVGVSIVRRARDLARAVRTAARFGGDVLIERYVPGREVTVGVVDGRALGALEVVAKGDAFHTYAVKYTAGREDFYLPARLDRATTRKVLALAERAHAVLGCDAYSRVDFRVDGTRPYLIELNTLPGMTALSYLPRIAAAAGLDYPALCERILDAARLRVRETRR
ncbi:MAG TPA: D-alanine--D-alanine ligase [Candidatus Binatia bacterium]